MSFTEVLLAAVGPYISLAAYVSGFINEETILFLMILATTGTFALWKIVVFGFLGTVSHDSIVYLLGRSRPALYFKQKFKITKKHRAQVTFIERLGGRTYFVPLTISKFIYGTRIALILYVSHQQQSFKRFFAYNTAALACWFMVMTPIAWLAGKGLTKLLNTIQSTGKVIGIAVVSILLLFFVGRVIYGLIRRKNPSATV